MNELGVAHVRMHTDSSAQHRMAPCRSSQRCKARFNRSMVQAVDDEQHHLIGLGQAAIAPRGMMTASVIREGMYLRRNRHIFLPSYMVLL